MKRKLSLFLALVMIFTSVFVTGASATGEDQEYVDEDYSTEDSVDEESDEEYAEDEEYSEDEEASEETDSEDAEGEQEAGLAEDLIAAQEGSYENYKADKGDFANAEAEIVIDATSYVSANGAEVKNLDTFKPENGDEKQILSAEVNHNEYGGIHIQHTGSTGASATVISGLKCEYGK